MRRKFLLSILIMLLLCIISACSNNGLDDDGIDNGDQNEVVSTEVWTIEELNEAFSTDTDIITLMADIEGNVVVENRNKDLILDLNGFDIIGDLEIKASENTTDNWKLEIEGSEGKITGDFTIEDSYVLINKEDLTDLVEGNIYDERPIVSGKISFPEGTGVDQTLVAVISNSDLEISSFEELDIVVETYAESNGNYTIEGVPTGKYYVIAYKEVNGTNELEFIEIDGSMEPVEPNGVYCDNETEEPLQIEVLSENLSDIDIALSTEADRYDISINVFAPLQGEEESVTDATISLYSKSGIIIGQTQSDSNGNATFSGIYGGHYYLEASGASLGTISFVDTKTPVYEIMEQDDFEGSNDLYYHAHISLFSEQDIRNVFGVTEIDNYGFVLFAEDVDTEYPFTNYKLELIPTVSSVDIGYSTFESINQPPYLDFSLNSFPEAEEDDTYLAGIRNLPAGTYRIGLEGFPDEDKELIEVEEGKLIYIEIPGLLF